MPRYLVETHAHTSVVSPCGRLSPAELVAAYVNAGYAGLIVTDHFVDSLPAFRGIRSVTERVHAFFAGYRAVRVAAAGTGLCVYPGLELTLRSLPGCDILVYGLDEERLLDLPDICSLDPTGLRDLADRTGALLFQAHPFRGRGPAPRWLLDGVEIYNGNARHDSRNERAVEYANRHGLLTISGSDAHQLEDVARGGIAVEALPGSIHDLVRLYRERPEHVSVVAPDPEGRPLFPATR